MPNTYTVLLLALFLSNIGYAQKVISGEEQQNPVQEKIYLHRDRPAYVAGETMWFKLYIVDAQGHAPLDLSKVAYLELLDRTSKAILQTKVSVSEGVGDGAIYLPLSISSGNYVLRAYTNWMKNFGNNSFFEEELTIINTMYSSTRTGEDKVKSLNVQFFPEGGDLVKGLRSKVAYRVVDQQGKGLDFEGALVNDIGDTITLFRPDQLGIGFFYYTPPGNGSTMVLLKVNDTVISEKLPEALERGFVTELNDKSEEEIVVSVISNEDYREPIQLKISSTSGNTLMQEFDMDGNEATLTINKDRLGEGISVLTFLDSDSKPRAERLYFKYPKEKLEIEAKPDKRVYSQREKIKVDISLSGNNTFSRSDMSMSVFKLDSINIPSNSDIYSYLWLSSELSGKIEAPDFYFKTIDSTTRSAMDNLMLTHGWRKFESDDLEAEGTSVLKFIPEYEGLTIKASLLDNDISNNFRDIPFYLSISGKMSQLYGTRSDESGNLYFVTNNLYGEQRIVIQPGSSSQALSGIKIEDPFSLEPALTKPHFLDLQNIFLPDLNIRHIHMQTQNIYWSSENTRIAPIDSANFYGYVDKSYLLDDYTRFPTMEEVLKEYVSEVVVRKTGKDFYLRIVKAPHEIHLDDPLALINNVPVFDINKIMAYNPMLIRQIDVIKDGYILEGEILLRGIINFKLYENSLEDVIIEPEATVIDFEGLQAPRIFYSPMYGDDINIDSSKPDFRNLLYWEPSLKVEGSDTSTISFYAGDLGGRYVGVVQGLDEEGNAGYSTFVLEIDAAQPGIKNN